MDKIDNRILGACAASAAIGLAVGTVYGKSAGCQQSHVAKPLADLQSQTICLPDGSRMSRIFQDRKENKYLFPDVLTLYDCPRKGKTRSNDGPMLGARIKQADGTEPYEWISYGEALARADNISLGIRSLSVAAGNKTCIGIFSKNRPEWTLIEMASYNFNNVLVPVYETLGAEECQFIINQTEMPIVFVDSEAKAKNLIKAKKNLATLKHIVVFDTFDPKLTDDAAKANVQLLQLSDIEEDGSHLEKEKHEPPKPSDLATICYTSGTTGMPKGVMLTHGNIVSEHEILGNIGPHPSDKTDGKYAKGSVEWWSCQDVMISYLPLAHMLSRVIESSFISMGGAIGCFRGDVRTLIDDIQELKPTIFVAVPRVLNRLYDVVYNEVRKSPVKKFVFDWAISSKEKELMNGVIRNDGFWDEKVFAKVRERLGGRVRFMLTGSAPISPTVLTFVRAAVGCVMLEGYGQTECVAAATLSLRGDNKPGHVGVPVPNCRIKLVDVPDLGYYANKNGGEVCISGPHVSKGYYKNEKMTAETFKDGWLHTGDIGVWTPEGTLKIVDRKKHIFKLSQGEYVAPEKIEQVYGRCKFVAQCFVHGDSLKTCVIAVIIPNEDVLAAHCKAQGISGSLADLCKKAEVKKLILDDMLAVGKNSKLCGFEQVKDIFLHPELCSVENDLLTPTMKIRRPQVKKRFEKELAAMYSKLE